MREFRTLQCHISNEIPSQMLLERKSVKWRGTSTDTYTICTKSLYARS